MGRFWAVGWNCGRRRRCQVVVSVRSEEEAEDHEHGNKAARPCPNPASVRACLSWLVRNCRLPSYEESAADLLTKRVLEFLAA